MYCRKFPFVIVFNFYSICIVIFDCNCTCKGDISVSSSSENSALTSRRRPKLDASLLPEEPQRNLRKKVNIDALIESFLQNDPTGVDLDYEETTPAALSSPSPSPSSENGGDDIPSNPLSESLDAAATTIAAVPTGTTNALTSIPTLISPANNDRTQAPFPLTLSSTVPIWQSPLSVDVPFSSSPLPLLESPTLASPSLDTATTSAAPSSRPVPGEAYITVVPSQVDAAGDGESSSEGLESALQQNSDIAPSPTSNEELTSPAIVITAQPVPSASVVRPATSQPMPQWGFSMASGKTAAPVVSSSSSSMTTISPIINDVKPSPAAVANRNPLPVLAAGKPLVSEFISETPHMVKNITASPLFKTTVRPTTMTMPKASNGPAITPNKTSPPVGVLQGKPIKFIISPAYTVHISPSPSPSPLPPQPPSVPTASNSSYTPGLAPAKSLTNITSPSMVDPTTPSKGSKPSTASSLPLTAKPKVITTHSSSPLPALMTGPSPMIAPSKALHPAPSIGTIEVSSSPWPIPTIATAPAILPSITYLSTPSVNADSISSSPWPNQISNSHEQQLVLDRKRLANNHDPTNVEKELLPKQDLYLKIDEASQTKASKVWSDSDTYAFLVFGIFLVGSCILLFTYHYGRMR